MLLSPSGCAFAAAGQVGYAQQIGFLYLFGSYLFLELLGFAFTSCLYLLLLWLFVYFLLPVLFIIMIYAHSRFFLWGFNKASCLFDSHVLELMMLIGQKRYFVSYLLTKMTSDCFISYSKLGSFYHRTFVGFYIDSNFILFPPAVHAREAPRASAIIVATAYPLHLRWALPSR